MDSATILGHLIGKAQVLPIYVAAEHTGNGRKSAYPTPILSLTDLESLIVAHLAGSGIPARTCTRLDGTCRTERNAFAIGSYPFHHDDGPVCRWLALDIDGGNHQRGDDERALAAVQEAVRVLRGEGLGALVVRSHSGHGYHVWLPFQDPQPAAFTHWLAVLLADLVLKCVPGALVEAFPKQSYAALGNPLALPFAGAVVGHGGGVLIEPADISAFTFASDAALSPFLSHWKRWLVDQERAAERRRVQDRQRAAKISKRGDAIERCRKYLAAVPPAVTGAHGDVATFKAAMAGGDFGLSDQDFLPLLREWNSRCCPPWSDSDLEKKLISARNYRKAPGSPAKPFGWKVSCG